MNVNFGINLHNRFDLVLTDSATNEVKQVAKAENVVVDSYYTNFFSRRNAATLCLGTGSGIPAASDTTLFSFLCAIGYSINDSEFSTTDGHVYTYKKTITFTEPQAVGTLSEIGIAGCRYYDYSTYWYNDNLLYTHAIFTDAEGNPVTITKTNADRLTIDITVYITIAYSNTNSDIIITLNRRTATNVNISASPKPEYIAGDNLPYGLLSFLAFGNYNPLSGQMYVRTVSTPLSRLINQVIPSVAAGGSAAATVSSSNDATKTYRNTRHYRILSTECNYSYPSTYLIKCIDNIWAQVPLPNSNVYPPRLFTLTATADGIKTDFNFNIPILNTNNVKVYIDNVLQATDTYTFYGRNYRHPQAWDSADTLYLTRISKLSSTGYYGWGTIHGYNIAEIDSATFYYDFKTPYTVSAVGKFTPSSRSVYSLYELYYSDDGENWAQLPMWTTTASYQSFPNIDNDGGYLTVPTTSARYWKATCPSPSRFGSVEAYFQIQLLFGDPKPQLHFNTAPPADATITIEAYCDYPIKNSNWIIESGTTFDYTFTRQ